MARPRRPLLGHIAGAGGALALMVFIVLLTAAVLVFIGLNESRFGTLRAAVALPLMLMVGLGSLLALLTIMVALLHGFGLTDRRRAFGLPDGSIQAVIALSLVLIFVIASLYLYSSLPETLVGRDAEAVQNRREFAQQLLTTVGTLAVAVAGFYFGTRSVETAVAAAGAAATGTVRVVWPRSPIVLDTAPETRLEPIIVETDPADQSLRAFIADGDPDGMLEQRPNGEYRYIRGSQAGAIVRLVFELADRSDRAELVVSGP